MLYFVGRRDWVKGRVVEMSHAVKNKANGILFLKGNYMYLYPIPRVRGSFTLKQEKVSL